MNIYIFDENKIISFSLPNKKVGNFWITDYENNNLINVSAEMGKWTLSCAKNIKLLSGNDVIDSIELQLKKYYVINKNDKNLLVYTDYLQDNSFSCYEVSEGDTINIGKNNTCTLFVNNQYFLDLHFSMTYKDKKWVLKKNENAAIYVNDSILISNECDLKNSDVINVYGLKIVIVNNLLFINNPFNNTIDEQILKKHSFNNSTEMSEEEIANDKMYKDDDYFLKSPRLKRSIKTFNMKVDSPPQKESAEEMPLILTLGPMLTMAASACVTLTSTLQRISNKEATLKQSIPTLIISVTMIASMLVWPMFTRWYEKKKKKEREDERVSKYKNYLDTKKGELVEEWSIQKKIIEESLLPLEVCYDTILNKRRTLWERKLDQEDFLTVRVGKGETLFDAQINYEKEDFTMEDDGLKKMLDGLIKSFSVLDNVPIGYSFSKNNKTAINGVDSKYIPFINNCLLQMMSYHSYDCLKIVVFTNKKKESNWNYIKESLYNFSDDKTVRFFATNTEEMQEVSDYLTQIFDNRKILSENGNSSERINDYSGFNNYYLILIDNIDSARRINIINEVLEEKKNLGFSLLILEEKLSKLPSQVSNFITIGETQSMILKNDTNEQIRFNNEIVSIDMNKCSEILSNLPLYIDSSEKNMPSSLTFLELFGVGQIEQLNVLNRWKDNNPIKSLKAEIGVNENCDPFILDLHEKQHGPHGLVAGMTGSGKSEFIITYVLSMAVNYSPEEVAFVLIDYKGGGLAGAFVSSELNMKLPHVVGTITNLDKSEINRALSSIDSELRRRQRIFNEVREQSGESTIDIYKYQRMYRDGVVKEPIPHLIIVCDEFAELKNQQPEFMEDLISTARIGRSLGVHLILATQKPSGVVDAQIWSNSKFKVCLKVQDKSDSMEMIKNDLAAELKNVGRFYLQVGYNEYFAMGQAAYAGAPYYPSKEFKKPVDKNLYFIDNVGDIKKTINNTIAKKLIKSDGEELSSILKYIIDISKDMNFKIKQLWLERIPNEIYLDNLVTKYNYKKKDYNIIPIIGEYDDPFNQSQELLTLPLNCEGNTIIYGSSDSGKDELLETLVYSIITNYVTNEVNLYLLDFGAETLMNFEASPQVGNVILNGDDEKLLSMVKLLNAEMNKRKKLFTSYNGNYNDYIKMSKIGIPNIIVVINGIEVMTEVYQDLVDKLIPVIREGSKYGINFVITTINQNSVKFKISQCCKQVICLQLNSDNEYKDILGKTDGIVPFNSLGRGLIKLDRVCEFQTAFIAKEEDKLNTIKATIDSLNGKGISHAMEVPTMPDIIKIDRFNDKYKGLNTVPLGLSKEQLTSQLYNFTKGAINIISSTEFDNIKLFIKNFLKVIELKDNFSKIVIDANNYFEDYNYNIKYFNNDFNKVVDMIKVSDDSIQKILSENNMNIRSLKKLPNNLCIIFGINKFMNKLDDEHKTIFKKIIQNNKEALKINFVFIDVPSNIKTFEFEDWFKNTVNLNEGIWIGGGFAQQFILKSVMQPQGISNIDNEYGIYLKNGIPTIFKIINEFKD